MTDVLEVDVANPGQVFACLGLLEILDLLSPPSVGRFVSEKEFHVDSHAPIFSAVAALARAETHEERLYRDPPPWGGDKDWPVALQGSFGELVLDPWLRPDHSDTASGLKLWAGRVSTLELLRGLLRLLPSSSPLDVRHLFDWESSGTPTGLDPRSAVSKEDLGYSYNSQKLKPIVYPAVDAFAMVGLQGSRPRRTGGVTYAYSLWEDPLPPMVGRAALVGAVSTTNATRWVYRVESRGMGGTYRYLSQASPEGSET